MPLDNHDHSSEETAQPQPKVEGRSGFLGKHLNRVLLAAGLALSSPALAADAPTKGEVVQPQKQQLDATIGLPAPGLEGLRNAPNLDGNGVGMLDPKRVGGQQLGVQQLDATISPLGTKMPRNWDAPLDSGLGRPTPTTGEGLGATIAPLGTKMPLTWDEPLDRDLGKPTPTPRQGLDTTISPEPTKTSN